MNKKRKLGSGFGPGNEFHLYETDTYQGLINGFPESKRADIAQWVNQNGGDKRITDILSEEQLALVISDVLVDLDITRLKKLMPDRKSVV